MAQDGSEAQAASLGEESILSEALETAGRAAFADESFREPMRVLLRSLDEEAGLNAAGRFTMRARIIDLLVNRLRLEQYLEAQPGTRDQRIGHPAAQGIVCSNHDDFKNGLITEPDAAQFSDMRRRGSLGIDRYHLGIGEHRPVGFTQG